MNKIDLTKAYLEIRTKNNTIPDDVLDFMYNAALEKLAAQQPTPAQGEEWELGENGKPMPPKWLQQKFYELADAQMEKCLKAGLLTNRFGIRGFAMDMMACGYDMARGQPSTPAQGEEAQAVEGWKEKAESAHNDFLKITEVMSKRLNEAQEQNASLQAENERLKEENKTLHSLMISAEKRGHDKATEHFQFQLTTERKKVAELEKQLAEAKAGKEMMALALRIAHRALSTYGPHPTIDEQIIRALNHSPNK
jgi:hypothetical protein